MLSKLAAAKPWNCGRPREQAATNHYGSDGGLRCPVLFVVARGADDACQNSRRPDQPISLGVSATDGRKFLRMNTHSIVRPVVRRVSPRITSMNPLAW